ncbi:hypothetical protein Plec18167_005502 [Paecilomyces lecythidis]|uniref:Uncharacterized protein n=1 Tax=Paecilomyces lecythidis TaxID=3004212 RepID=A0ABR3XHZ1_9EURO
MTRDTTTTLPSLPVISEEHSSNDDDPDLGDPADSSIVMAEQSSHDVVTQTQSGGEPSPSDVPASNSDKNTAGGDVGEIKDTATTEHNERHTNAEYDSRASAVDAGPGADDGGNASGRSTADFTKDGPGPVESRALELNGVASGSEREDTVSQGGSESDTSRTDGRHHTRTGSVKKPTSFKPVSFAKFSVPKTPGSVLTSKIVSEKASPSPSTTPQSTSRPRLVAKTTSSLRDSSRTPGAGAGGASGPDPNQVWNKNKPAQPPPTRHLTDEELKQQYGIHMTSRIQEDGGGTEAKWADIDDDEDDWAPETIEWNDGTKITLTAHAESSTTTSQEPKEQNDTKDAAAPAAEPSPTVEKTTKSIATKSTTSVGPNATVLRLGANAERQAKNAMAASKGANEKSTLTSKSPAPVPAKSPWAPLPPMEKASPVLPPVQPQSSSRFTRRESYVQEVANGPLPAKEIAADDFNRSWREGQSNLPRELYNSHSGRYEPVSDTRRGSQRNDQAFRAPSLLQRPSHHEQTGPAEPSAAFQTHRASAQEAGPWSRRRTSSNVSGGSGGFGRRMSLGRPDAIPKPGDARRGSQVNGALERSISPNDISRRGVSPGQQGAGPWRARTPTNTSYAPPGAALALQPADSSAQEQPAAVPQAPQEDPVAMQQRIMREKTMEARQRRKEQEEREEAERRERIRLKLEALGPPPSEKEKPKSQDASSTAKSPAREAAPAIAAPITHSPPKPPVPEPTGEPKQYGMMKVHHPDTVKKLVAASERTPDKPTSAPHGRRLPSPAREPKADMSKPNGLRQPHDIPPAQPVVAHRETLTDEKGPQWRSSLSPWVSGPKIGGHPSSDPNPWKPLSSDKTLGNGAFDRNLPGFTGRDLPLRGHLALNSEQPSIRSPPTNDERMGAPQPFSGSPRIAQDSTPISPLPEAVNPIARPGPIAPPSSQPAQRHHELSRAGETAAWHNFHNIATKREAEESERFHRDLASMRDDGSSSIAVSFNETWRQVRTGDHAGSRQVVGVTRTTEAGAPVAPLHTFDPAVGSLPFPEHHSRPFSSSAGRGSRFFPHQPEQHKPSVVQDRGLSRSPSPPPPEEISSHPVYTGNSDRPLVHLPTPKPVVKLPPKPTGPQRAPTFASMVASAPPVRVVPQPIASTTSWQDRFNGLFGKKPSTEKKQVLAVASATKEPLDVQSQPAPAAVSLPQYVEIDILRDAGKVTSKEVEEEEAIFEDREAGSLPVVRVPNMAPVAAWRAALPPSSSKLRSKYLKPMQVQSVETYNFGFHDKDRSGNIHVIIHFPGNDNTKSVTLPRKAGNHGQRQRGGASGFKSRKNTKNSSEGSSSHGHSRNFKKSNASASANTAGSSPRAPFGNASWSSPAFGVAH